MRIRIAQTKIHPKKGRPGSNYASLMSILREISRYKPDVVVTSECFLDGYISTEDSITEENIMVYAIDPTDSVYVKGISSWVSANEAWFVLGCTRATGDGACNTALILNREGDLVGTYDKVHCQAHDMKYLPGQGLPVFQSDFGPFGVMICADRRWPETVRSLVLQGARIIFNPTYGMHDERNLCIMRTRSFESEVFIVFTHPGQSLITGPKGQVLCNEEQEDKTFSITEINLSEVDQVRLGASSHLKGRRPDLYIA